MLPDIFPISFPGVKTSRDDVVVEIDRAQLIERMQKYFDANISHEEMKKIAPGVMEKSGDYDAIKTRDYLCKRGFLPENIVRYCYRPFDTRWLYWKPETKLLDRNRAEYFPHVFAENIWLEARQKQAMEKFDRGYVVKALADNFGNGLSNYFPLLLKPEQKQHSLFDQPSDNEIKPNLSEQALAYLGAQAARLPATSDNEAHAAAEVASDVSNGLSLSLQAAGEPPALPGNALPAETLFFHAVAVLHSPVYCTENSGALRQDWPRIPLPANRENLSASAALGKQIAALLDTETSVTGVTAGTIRPELKTIAVIAHAEGKQLSAADLQVTAGWGHGGKGGVTMPGKGKAILRDEIDVERAARPSVAGEPPALRHNETEIAGEPPALRHNETEIAGEPPALRQTYDIYLNNFAYWRNVPERVWDYTIGGYQVMKKWLSYRELELLGHALTIDEAREVTNMARRIAAILLLEDALNENYGKVKCDVYAWERKGIGN